MNDRGLLELAAKSIGLKDHVYVPGASGGMLRERVLGEPRFGHFYPAWNPLENDADALRLAVELGLEVHGQWSSAQVYIEVYTAMEVKFVEAINGDAFAATRRAIVRAAAHLGGSLS